MAKIWEPISRDWMPHWPESNSSCTCFTRRVRVSWRGPFFFPRFFLPGRGLLDLDVKQPQDTILERRLKLSRKLYRVSPANPHMNTL
jgi:hypothetical protein